jgi:hypothetical protein
MSNRCFLRPAIVGASCLWFALATGSTAFAEELRVPASTAYVDPDANGIRVRDFGAGPWEDPTQSLSWFGRIANPGKLNVAVEVRLPAESYTSLTLRVGESASEREFDGVAGENVRVDWGSFEIAEPGYVQFELSRLGDEAGKSLRIVALLLEGEAVEGAHFNLEPRRNASSVHLMYPTPKDAEVELFYCEVTGVEEPVGTFYMACGFHRGYFGMQVNGPSERRIIFSVWDSGDEAVDRDKVQGENRVRLVEKGEGVDAGDFGNEGTGGHSHLVYDWKTGETQRFLLAAKPTSETRTTFSGWWFHPDKKEWMLIASFDAPHEGGHLRGLHSFSENFLGQNGHLRRKALYGAQWIRTTDAKWTELTTAKFSHDPTGRSARLDRFMGIEEGKFFLPHGGFVEGFTKYGEAFERPPGDAPPSDLPASVTGPAK